MLKKVLCLLLGIIMVFCYSCSCSSDDSEDSGNGENYNEKSGVDFDNIIGYIVKDGYTEYTIVYGSSATKSEIYAANELQKYIYEISDVVVPIKNEQLTSFKKGEKAISVGKTDYFKNSGLEVDFSSFNGDGFIVRTDGNTVYLCGASDNGTLYGVYDLLEKAYGVKFLDVDMEYIPKIKEVPLYSLSIEEIPVFRYRCFLTDQTYHVADQDFYVKSRLSHEFLDLDDEHGSNISVNKDINWVHNNLTYVSKTKYYTDLDEQGRRENQHLFYFGNEEEPIDICYSDGINDDGSIDYGTLNAASAYMEGLKRVILNNPDVEYYTCGQEDITTCCNCSKCAAVKARYNGNSTAVVYRFYNAVAKDIQKWADSQTKLNGKKINIVIFSYYFTSEAPVKYDAENKKYIPLDESLILSDNITIRFGDITTNFYYSFTDTENEAFGYGPNYLNTWKDYINNSWWWSYYTNYGHYFSYVYGSMSKLKTNLISLAGFGTDYVLLQSNSTEYNDWQAIMGNYVAAKMLWNPNRNVKALQEEFINYFYGPAASMVMESLNDMDEWFGDVIKNKDSKVYYTPTTQYSDVNMWEKILSRIDGEIISVGNSESSINDKNLIIKHLKQMSLTPLYMLMIKRDVFYVDDSARLNLITKRFFETCKDLGVRQYGEHRYIETLKNVYSYTD